MLTTVEDLQVELREANSQVLRLQSDVLYAREQRDELDRDLSSKIDDLRSDVEAERERYEDLVEMLRDVDRGIRTFAEVLEQR